MPANDFNRPLQKSYMSAHLRRGDVLSQARNAVEYLNSHHPKLPVGELAELLSAATDPEIAPALDAILRNDFYVSATMAHRRKLAAANRAQSLLPGFEHLPLKIPLSENTRVRLMDANLTGVRLYYRSLMKAHRNRRRNDPKIKEAKALLDLMTARARTERGITVREVVLLEA